MTIYRKGRHPPRDAHLRALLCPVYPLDVGACGGRGHSCGARTDCQET